MLVIAVSAVAWGAALAQTPQPFPRPGSTPASQPAPQAPAQPAPSAPPAPSIAPGSPTEATLGFPLHPTAQFITSYDAGRAQRYYLFGSPVSYMELVIYYRKVLKEGGDQIFAQPATHVFEVGRFRDDTMAFPPGVTVKDWTMGGSGGYPNPRPGAEPARFPTIIMIVPPPPAVPAR